MYCWLSCFVSVFIINFTSFMFYIVIHVLSFLCSFGKNNCKIRDWCGLSGATFCTLGYLYFNHKNNKGM